MAHYLSRREVEDLKPSVEKVVYKTLGNSNSSVLRVALDCISNGYDRRKIADKLDSYLDGKKASKLAERIQDLIDDLDSTRKSKKRSYDDEKDRDSKRNRRDNTSRERESRSRDSTTTTASSKDRGGDKYSEKNGKSRKFDTKNYSVGSGTPTTVPQSSIPVPQSSIYGIPAGLLNKGDAEKARKIAQLKAQIKSKISTGVLGNNNPNNNTQMPLLIPNKPQPLILDEEGRTVDKTGKAIQLTHVAPTLKANLRALKREQYKEKVDKKIDDDLETRFIDPRIGLKSSIRNKRVLRFHEPGKFLQLADRLRMKTQLEKLQNEISEIAKKTGISSATKLALIAKSEGASDNVPEMEWWDSVILEEDLDTLNANGMIAIKYDAINNLVEHPTQMRCPTDPHRSVYMPVFFTKKERKKLRRQNRRERWKEEQEKIRLGLEPAPEPKLRISNLMRALGTEAVQDPTKIEAHVREQMAKRQKAHEEANAARKLTVEQKRDKKIKKIKEDTSLGVHVAVFRILHLHELASKKFKVETNAKQLYMSGCVVLYPDCCVVVVEGGPKQMKKYKRLMLQRVKWEEDVVKDPDGKEVPNKCVLVWEGTSKQRNFGEVKFKICPTERMARELFKKHKVEHYWDLAYSGAVLEQSNDLVD